MGLYVVLGGLNPVDTHSRKAGRRVSRLGALWGTKGGRRWLFGVSASTLKS